MGRKWLPGNQFRPSVATTTPHCSRFGPLLCTGMSADAPEQWDLAARDFDRQPDHGLTDPAVRTAWHELMAAVLPLAPARVADLGCGTGSLALLVAALGHRVDGIDLSAGMLARACAKAATDGIAGDPPSFARADAARPPFRAGWCDVVLCRHVLWALPDPAAALRRWAELLAPGGRIILVEGRWSTGAGLTAERVAEFVALTGGRVVAHHPLADPHYWGGPVDDERYLVVVEP